MKYFNNKGNEVEMTKWEIIDTIIYISDGLMNYFSKLGKVTPSIFDQIKSEDEEDDSTNDLTEEKNNRFLEKYEKKSMSECLITWVKELDIEKELLILAMMNIDKILEHNFILSEDNIKNVLFTCLVVSQKFFEDVVFKEKDYSEVGNIPIKLLTQFQIEFLDQIDYSLNVKESEFIEYQKKMFTIWKGKVSKGQKINE